MDWHARSATVPISGFLSIFTTFPCFLQTNYTGLIRVISVGQGLCIMYFLPHALSWTFFLLRVACPITSLKSLFLVRLSFYVLHVLKWGQNRKVKWKAIKLFQMRIFAGLNKGVDFIIIKMFVSMKCIYERT